MTDDDVLDHLQTRLPDFTPTGDPVRLPEGNLNIVWRVPGQPASIIAKHAPPYMAVNPAVPLDPSRLEFEARSLRALEPDGALAAVATQRIRPPRLLDMHTAPHVLLMEDVGTHPTLGRWLRESGAPERARAIGQQLGRFIGRLHAATAGDDELAERFDNRLMQETRLAVQYEAVGAMLADAGIADAEALGERAAALGERLLKPGICLTMGDLWPPSVLVAPDRLRIIDWELAHYGRPMQDVAHVAAHAWMQAHRAPHETARAAAQQLSRSFLAVYRSALTKACAEALLTPQMLTDAALHMGAEILVRTVGPFQAGYRYDGLAADAPPVQEALAVAAAHLRRPDVVDTFARLR